MAKKIKNGDLLKFKENYQINNNKKNYAIVIDLEKNCIYSPISIDGNTLIYYFNKEILNRYWEKLIK